MEVNDLHELVKQKIENLRPKLLDLSRRNPLLATKLSPRSNAQIRVVDELPDVLFYNLNNGQEMRLVPLPDIGNDPRDEETQKFRDALSNARLIDEVYLGELDSIDRDAEDYLDRTRVIERALKDRIRVGLGMPPRPRQADINLAQHARNNGITPSYDLPKPDGDEQADRHIDNDIQTLLLPKDLERKLNSITSKCRTWIQETGINVLHAAYGFLEWSEPNQTETSFAPLVLSSAQIEKRRTREGVEFYISGTGEEPEINAVLAEKMRIEFGIELPPFEAASVEEYFDAIAKIAPRQIVWKVRRQVAIGVFPSARMAMYHDINPENPSFPDSEIVRELLGGTNSEASSPFAEEYNVDDPEIEKSVPFIVMDADSSQFSTLVDIAQGKNVAVEGPPGTGKSQTIVNAIAAALAEGKKVLFVAEKLAALNVVRARLEAVGLGEFLLPLQAERSTREQVINSVRDRVEMDRPGSVRDYDSQLEEYRHIRKQLADYIELLTLGFGVTGMTVHEILSRSIATAPRLDGVSAEVIEQSEVPPTYLNKAGIGRLRVLGANVEKAAMEAALAKPHWKATGLVNADRFTVEEACNLATRASKAFLALGNARDQLAEFQIDREATKEALDSLAYALEGLPNVAGAELLLALLTEGATAQLETFIKSCEECAEVDRNLKAVLSSSPDVSALAAVERVMLICKDSKLETLDWTALQGLVSNLRNQFQTSRSLAGKLLPMFKAKPEAAEWPISAIAHAAQAIAIAGRDALLCRNNATSNPAALSLLQKLISEGRNLQAEKAELSSLVSLNVRVSHDALMEAIVVLRGGGLFSFLSTNYRNAKRLARSLLSADRFDEQEALYHLKRLAEYRRREQFFQQDPQAATLFGIHFRGVETDFAPFERLVDFYEATQATTGGPELRGLRNFLRDAEIDELEAVPTLTEDAPTETLATLAKKIKLIERRTSALNDALEELEPLLSVFRDPASVIPKTLPKLAEKMRQLAAQQKNLDSDNALADLLGAHFAGSRTKVEQLKPVCDWAKAAMPIAARVAAVLRSGKQQKAIKAIRQALNAQSDADALLERLCNHAKIDPIWFRSEHGDHETVAALEAAAGDADGLFAHAAIATALADLHDTGTEPLTRYLMADGTPTGLAEKFEALAVRKLARAVYAEHVSKLSRYPGSRLDDLRTSLARQDKEIIKLAQKQLRWRVHSSARPPRGNGMGRKSTWTDMALIENEISKQQRFISVRDLTQRAGRALLELKPCWMMSPLAVAQYVPKDALNFDICIIDEASQMPPEAAIGALLRSSQTVVVGDTNQLPPSSFFKKMIDDEEADEDETVLNESILEMANATFRPARRLRWHYRSRHSGLIKFSNRIVYNDDLIVFPSATESLARMGVEFRKCDGLYKSGTNATEARLVVEAVLEFMSTDPHRSLGVVTLNQKQRDLISEEFDYALGRDRHAQAFVDDWKNRNDGLEEFFIKNLENVQGDERDVIFIGTVYGPEALGGTVAQRFGPINGIAGKRRLNVLFSRAKEKIVTFSSMTAADIAAEENGNAGVYMLKRWLEYAATGVLDGGASTTREPDSDFELFVMAQIRAMGCEPVPQVGVAGYFIDIGVRHPDWPHGFVLGVECDGASYHSAKSARDRDRLRQEVLERLGWRIHRIWSTDWFNSPRREAERLREVITSRMVELKTREAEFLAPPQNARQVEAERASRGTVRPQGELPGINVSTRSPEPPPPRRPANDTGVAIGDTVRVRYLNGDCKVLLVTISTAKTDLEKGLINHKVPIAQALLGAEKGDEVEVLTGSYVRPAVIEEIIKPSG
jgi:very-short-patch-repair endonuclease